MHLNHALTITLKLTISQLKPIALTVILMMFTQDFITTIEKHRKSPLSIYITRWIHIKKL